MATKQPKIEAVRAYAWLCDFGLCSWAEPSANQLMEAHDKPSTEARPIKVAILSWSDYLALRKDRK